jgi:hypothetical protein
VSTDRDLSDFERTIVANVREHGCHINFVSDPERNQPDFAYSVGFPETLGQPEVIVFGLPVEVMQFMINETFRKCQAGFRLEDGIELDGLLDGHICVVGAVSPDYITPDYFNSAIWFRRYTTGEEMDAAAQIIWPGVDDGLFPWDDGCADIVRNLQPCLIGEPDA